MAGNDLGDLPGQLLARAAAGETNALKPLLYLTREPLLWRIRTSLPRRFQSLIDAEDVLQLAHTKAFRAIKTFRPLDADAFHSWLTQIADNALADECRRLGRRKRGGCMQPAHRPEDTSAAEGLLSWLEGHDSTPSRTVARQEAIKALHVAIAALPDRQREAVTLVCIQQLSAKEAAQKLRITESAVRSLVDRAREKLRQELGNVSKWLSSR
jgi:RNA polymerase sigma-70 factor, ECF subfamily